MNAEVDVFPPFIDRLPAATLDIEGLSGWTLKGAHGVVVFLKADRDVHVPRHHHGAQWGVVLAGTMELTINEITRTYGPGESHHIPAGVEHEATLLAGWRGMYFFVR